MRGMQSVTNNERATEEDIRVAEPSFLLKNERQGTGAQRVLADVYELLEDYAPAWYSARLRDRILTALTGSETKR